MRPSGGRKGQGEELLRDPYRDGKFLSAVKIFAQDIFKCKFIQTPVGRKKTGKISLDDQEEERVSGLFGVQLAIF